MNAKVRLSCIVAAMALSFFLGSCGKRFEVASKIPQTEKFKFERTPTNTISFLSTQMNPVEEAGKMRNSILRDFPGKVDFRPNDTSYLLNQIDARLEADPDESVLIGALHGDLVKMYENDALRPLDDVVVELIERNFPETLIGLSRLNGKNSYYIPWMQASFIMVANRKALPYLPNGADLNTLTYEQLSQWGKNILEKTGKKAIGFPVGGKGLMHRFLQGYLYPSFTGNTLLRFRTEDAEAMWKYFKDLWTFVHPGSLTYSTMADPLLAGDVLIAWDHTARFVKAFEERPGDFVAFPAPIGPKGRGFMAVISGLAIPKRVKNATNPAILIDYLTRPEIQLRTLSEVGFFPVVRADAGAVPKHLQELSRAVTEQSNSLNPVPTLLPIGLGEHAGDFNNLFTLTFNEIVLEKKDIAIVLNANAAELQKIINIENAKCWLPDRSEERPCKIE